MSFLAMRWCNSPYMLQRDLKPCDLAVLRALCWVYDDNGTPESRNCYCGVKYLAKVTGFKASSINKAKEHLRELGLISWDRAANFGNEADYQTNNYRLNCPELQQKLAGNKRTPPPTPTFEYDEEAELDNPHPMPPGMLYPRPDPKNLRVRGPLYPPTQRESELLADILAFVGDTEENRTLFLRKMRQQKTPAHAQTIIRRVLKTSRKGRRITDRVLYLAKALTPKRA